MAPEKERSEYADFTLHIHTGDDQAARAWAESCLGQTIHANPVQEDVPDEGRDEPPIFMTESAIRFILVPVPHDWLCIWITGTGLPWATEEDCAKEAYAAMQRSVRYDDEAEDSPLMYTQIDSDGMSVGSWIDDL